MSIIMMSRRKSEGGYTVEFGELIVYCPHRPASLLSPPPIGALLNGRVHLGSYINEESVTVALEDRTSNPLTEQTLGLAGSAK